MSNVEELGETIEELRETIEQLTNDIYTLKDLFVVDCVFCNCDLDFGSYIKLDKRTFSCEKCYNINTCTKCYRCHRSVKQVQCSRDCSQRFMICTDNQYCKRNANIYSYGYDGNNICSCGIIECKKHNVHDLHQFFDKIKLKKEQNIYFSEEQYINSCNSCKSKML